jgi:hypothetical protein
MGLSKVHFKPNLHIFPYLEIEVMMSSIFFSRNTYKYFGIFKELIFLNKFCKEKNLLSCLNRDDCEFLIILFFTNLLIIF